MPIGHSWAFIQRQYGCNTGERLAPEGAPAHMHRLQLHDGGGPSAAGDGDGHPERAPHWLHLRTARPSCC